MHDPTESAESAEADDPARDHPTSVTIDVVVFTLQERELHLLLVKRKRWPFADCWAIPGGFILRNESLEQAARRELAAQTGVRDVYLEQLYTFGTPTRDPRTRVISIAYIALVRADLQTLRASAASTEVGWFPVRRLPGPLAFDHDQMLATALTRLRSKLEYTTLAFQLLPEVFSILELKQIYEQILGEQLDKGNFYRKIKDAKVLEDTGLRRTGHGRPTTLYRFRRERGAEQFVFRWRESRMSDADA
jgi:8-oxo-dGTP diphosphatase